MRPKLLPDWPYFPNVPPGTPCPPTLVLDLEGTLWCALPYRWVPAALAGRVTAASCAPLYAALCFDGRALPPGRLVCLCLCALLCCSTSVWDHKHGWRHVKRPGVEKFLKEVSRYFEVVIFSPNIAGIADPIISGLDKARQHPQFAVRTPTFERALALP